MLDAESVAARIRPILADIRTVTVPPREHPEAPRRVQPFITLSREVGAGAWTLAQRLVEHLNLVDPGQPPWSSWDRELVEKVAADHRISTQLVESLEVSNRNWVSDFFSGLTAASEQPMASEEKVYRGVITTIRALAQVGRVVIVGRGGAFITHNMPGGIHVRLVAPFDARVKHMAELLGVSEREAAARVRELEHNRHAFYTRYWPSEKLSSEAFTLTINTPRMTDDQMVNCILPLVHNVGELRPAQQSMP